MNRLFAQIGAVLFLTLLLAGGAHFYLMEPPAEVPPEEPVPTTPSKAPYTLLGVAPEMSAEELGAQLVQIESMGLELAPIKGIRPRPEVWGFDVKGINSRGWAIVDPRTNGRRLSILLEKDGSVALVSANMQPIPVEQDGEAVASPQEKRSDIIRRFESDIHEKVGRYIYLTTPSGHWLRFEFIQDNLTGFVLAGPEHLPHHR